MPPAKKRRESNEVQLMRKYITCKRWRKEKEDKDMQDKTTRPSGEGQGPPTSPRRQEPRREDSSQDDTPEEEISRVNSMYKWMPDK